MSEVYAVVVDGLEALDRFENLSADVQQAARRAVNLAANRFYAAAGRQITSEINYPKRYVTGKNARMQISKLAKGEDLSATITARSRPTSLARFVTSGVAVRKGSRKAGVSVAVEPGQVKRLKGAWLIRLRAGSEKNLDTQSNLGLAVRTKNGRPPPGYKPYRLAPNVYLLYGPSVASALYSVHNKKGVATDITPQTLDILEKEFWRQMDLKA